MGSAPESPRVILTGASTGIGLALSQRFKDSKYRVVLTARESSLPRLHQSGFRETERILIRPLDVTDESQRKRVVEEVTALWGGVDVLINNAGISYRSVVEEMSTEEDRAQLETNYIGPMDLTRLVLSGMRKQRWGRIINVSSVGGMMAMPTMGSYSASKFALEGASEALWYELKPWNVAVTLVQPGFIHSNSFRGVYWSNRAKQSCSNHGDYAPYYDGMSTFIERLMDRAIATPNSIAEQILRCIEDSSPPLRVPATIDASIFSLIRRLLPRSIYHWILYRNLPGVSSWGVSDEDR